MLRTIRLLPFAVLMAAQIAFPCLSSAQHEEAASSSSAQSKRPSRSYVHTDVPSDYGKYRQDFTDLCAGLIPDGRQPMIYDLLISISEKDPACIDCRPLINQWASVCRPKVVRATPTPTAPAEDGAEEVAPPTPTPLPAPARLPNLSVLDSISGIGRRMAEDDAHVAKTIQAVDKILKTLNAPEGKTAAQREYCQTLGAYLNAPFAGARAAIKAAANRKQNEEAEGAAEEQGSHGTEGLFER